MVETKERVLYFDCLRIIAALFVVVLHTSTSHFGEVNVYSLEWKMFNLYDGLSRWTVPMFIMMSGALFLGRPVSIEKLWKKNILRIAVAFVVWSGLYVLEYQWCHGATHPLDGAAAVKYLVQGHFHLWFLQMLMGVYAMIPLLEPVVRSEKLLKYFMGLAFLLSVLLPTLNNGIKYFALPVTQGALAVKGSFGLSFGYLFYFVLGYCLTVWDTDRFRVPIYVLGVLGFAVTIGLTDFLSVRAGVSDFTFYDYNYLNVLCQTVCMFQLGKDLLGKLRYSDTVERLILTASKCSFGVYLIHPFALDFLEKVLGLHTLSFTSVLSVPVVAAAAFGMSYALSYVLNKIPVLNKYIV